MMKIVKHKLFSCIVIVMIPMILIILTAAVSSGCGIITSSSDSDADEGLTFATREDYERNDVYINDLNNTSNTDNTDAVDIVATTNTDDNADNANTKINPESTTVAETAKPVETETEIETEAETESPPAPPQVVKVSFLAAGDNIMHMNMIDDAKQRAGEGANFNFKDMYTDIAPIVQAYDIALINIETPIAGDEFEYSGYPMFNTPKENAFDLMDMGFNIINTANNHMLDKWEKGYKNSIEFWDSHKNYKGGNILQLGSFKDAADFETPRIYNMNGISIAFLSYTYGTNGMALPAGSKMVIPFLQDTAMIERQIKAARPLADCLFVVMHWGEEDHFTPSASQKNLAQMMVDNGVDVIIGMHPHVLQETKWVDRPDGGKTLITYSIGNLISGMLYKQNMIGSFLGFDIIKTTQNGESSISIENAKMIPTVTHYNMDRMRFQIYNFENYTEELAKQHGCIKFSSDFSYKYLKDLIITNIAPEFLSDFYKS